MKLNFNIDDPAHVTGTASLASSTASITLFGYQASDIGVLLSALVALLTFALHVWYTLRKDRRAKEIHAARLRTGDLDGQPE